MGARVGQWALWCMVGAVLLGELGCSEETTAAPEAPQLRVDLFGYGPDATGMVTFVQGLPAYPGAQTIEVRMTDPVAGKELAKVSGSVAQRSIKVPRIDYGQNLRLELEVTNAGGVVLASGATPTFDFEPEGEPRALRVMMAPTNQFSPLGAIYRDPVTGKGNPAPSVLDTNGAFLLGGSTLENLWVGRVGHAAAPTSDGKVLVVGGAYVTQTYRPNAVPMFRAVYGDLQLYDPATGYFTDLSFDEETRMLRPEGRDRLFDSRAFHTLTPLGNDRFIVAGGYTNLNGETRAVRTLELINLQAEPGRRVQALTNSIGELIQTFEFRAMHEAVYVPQRQWLVLIGGLGASSEEVLDSVEVVDLGNLVLVEERPKMSQARVGHKAVLLEDGSIWVIGGRGKEGALKGTDIVMTEAGGATTMEGPTMVQARYGMGVSGLETPQGRRVLVVGGYTDAEGGVTATMEVGGLELAEFQPVGKIARARGGLDLVKLPQTGDLMVFGGYDQAQRVVSQAERLSFKGFQNTPPFDLISAGIGEFRTPRYGATYSLMTNGQIMAVGGVARVSVPGSTQTDLLSLDDAEIYNGRDPVPAEN